MSGFSAGWLALREPFDAAARDRDLARRFAEALPPNARIVDLGGGTGANIRFLDPFIAVAHDWLLVDADAALLSLAVKRSAPIAIATQQRDLNAELLPVLDFADGVTCSALMDLVSAAWLERFASELAERHQPFLAALSVDGRIAFDPPVADDALVISAFARDQGRDKGFFGPALGPGAPAYLAERLAALGYAVYQRPSDWLIGGGDTAMHGMFLHGFAAAAREAAPESVARIDAWASVRQQQVADRQLTTRVGHIDVFALWG